MNQSYIKLPSKKVKQYCEVVLKEVETFQKRHNDKLIQEELRKKNSGISGWFRKLFNSEYDEVEAEWSLLRKGYTLNIGWRTEKMAKALCLMSEETATVLVGRDDYDELMRWREIAKTRLAWVFLKAEEEGRYDMAEHATSEVDFGDEDE